MIAYSSSDIANFVVHLEVGKAGEQAEAGEEWSTFIKEHPYPFYSPASFIRLGLFFLTVFMVLLVFIFLWLLAGSSGSDSTLGMLLLITGVFSMLASEYFAQKRKHFQSGIDEALHCCIVVLYPASAYLFFNFPGWLIFLSGAATATWLYLRFLSALQAGVAVTCLFFSISLSAVYVMPAFVYALPVGMLAAALYHLLKIHISRVPVVYLQGILMVRYCLLIAAIFYSNFTCVSMANGFELVDSFISVTYKVTTFLFPVLLLIYGIARKDIVPVHVATVSVLFAFYTAYLFTGASQPFVWLTVCGGAVIIVCVMLMKWLRTSRRGFVYRNTKDDETQKWLEILISANAPQTKSPAADVFGGGDFGGGGASGNF